MEFRLIDLKRWKRKAYFTHYFESVPCTYSMTVKLDITTIKTGKAKLYPTLLYAVSTVVNRHEEFRMAVDDEGQIGIFSEMMPCYTIFHKDTEMFSNIWTKYIGDYTEFCKQYEKDMQQYGENKGMMAKPNPPVNTFPVSMIPWTTFEGFNLNLQKGYGYLLPIFTFGRYYEENGKYWIPLSIQVHHAVWDGFHTCRFINELQEVIKSLPNHGGDEE